VAVWSRGSRPDLLLRAAIGQVGPGRCGFPRADVGGYAAEQGIERGQVCVGEARSQLGVEGDRGIPQARERHFARFGKRDHLDSPVGGVAGPGDQPAGVLI